MRGPYLQNLAAARKVEWGKSYDWDMFIPDAPAPFNQWFPASEIDRELASHQPHDFNVGAQGFKVPYSSAQRSVRLTFYDNENAVLEKWLDDWYNLTVMDDTGHVSTLSEVTRDMHFAQLNNRRQLVRYVIMSVFPEGQFNSQRNSNSEALVHVCSFSIVSRQVEIPNKPIDFVNVP